MAVTASPVQLGNRYKALDALEDHTAEEAAREDTSTTNPRQGERQPSSWRKRHQVIVVGDSLLRGTEGPIYRPHPTAREVCCLPRARRPDITVRIPDLIQPSDYCPMVLIHAGMNDVARSSLASHEQLQGSGGQA